MHDTVGGMWINAGKPEKSLHGNFSEGQRSGVAEERVRPCGRSWVSWTSVSFSDIGAENVTLVSEARC